MNESPWDGAYNKNFMNILEDFPYQLNKCFFIYEQLNYMCRTVGMDDFHMLKTVSMDATHVVCAYPTGSAAVRCCKGAEPVPETTYGCQNRKILGSCYGSKQ